MMPLETRRSALVARGFLLALLALVALAGCKKDEPGLAARFDYSVPERFAVPDPRAPEGQYEIYVDGVLHPDQWRVHLNACASTGRPVSYAWSVDGALVGESQSCGPFEWDLPAEGTYSVTLVVEDAEGDTRELTQDVVIRDILMFGIGDSYGSGEGNPDVPLSIGAIERLEIARAEAETAAAALDALQPGALASHAGAPEADTQEVATARAAFERAEAELVVAQGLATVEWQHRRCHRSALSGQVRAAQLLEERDEHTSVTFVHLACSGARMHRGVLGEYLGVEPDDPDGLPYPPQIDRVDELADDHEIDALVISVGGNDANFANVIEACVIGEDCHDAPVAPDATLIAAVDAVCTLVSAYETECREYFADLLAGAELDAKKVFDEHLEAESVDGVDLRQDGNDDLPDSYRDLADEITARLVIDPAHVFLTEYPDVTRNASGRYCGWDTVPLVAAIISQPPGIMRDEMVWADTYVATELRATMRAAATEHGWHFIDDVASRFTRHGYCSSSPWLVRLQNTFFIQGDPYGAFHPNEPGHAVYADAIADAIGE